MSSDFNTQENLLNKSSELEDYKDYFSYLALEDKTECKLCKIKLSGHNEYNNKRHFIAKHQAKANELGVSIKRKNSDNQSNSPQQKKARRMTRGRFIQDCVELVTVHAMPLESMNYPPFRDLTNVHSQSTKLTINAKNIGKFIQSTADEIKEQIKKEVKKRMVSLKLDIGSRFDKSVLGVNIQFYSKVECKIVVRTLGMIELEGKHTAQALEKEILNLLKLYGIDLRNLYTYTSDNGSNMICLGNMLQSMQHDLLLGDELKQWQQKQSEDDSEDSEEEDDCENEGEGEEFASNKLDSLLLGDDIEDRELNERTCQNEESHRAQELLAEQIKQLFAILSVIRCACHVLNLAVVKCLKSLGAVTTISEVRQIVKLLKGIKYKRIFKELKIPRPKLDVETRWNSLYMMFSSLLKIKGKLDDVFKLFAKKDVKDVEIKLEQWIFIEKFCEAFEPAFEATKRLQATQLPMSK